MQVSRVVTLAWVCGAGGSVIGPRVAERPGVPFLDRAIPGPVAERGERVLDPDRVPAGPA